ncbi:hypothetical protein ACFV0D_16465, partial [Streptomyces sp. NPDC059556]
MSHEQNREPGRGIGGERPEASGGDPWTRLPSMAPATPPVGGRSAEGVSAVVPGGLAPLAAPVRTAPGGGVAPGGRVGGARPPPP